MSKLFTMEQTDYDTIVDAITEARSTPLIALHCGMPASPQETANREWEKLGRRLGFKSMSVTPGPTKLQFYADPI